MNPRINLMLSSALEFIGIGVGTVGSSECARSLYASMGVPVSVRLVVAHTHTLCGGECDRLCHVF